MKSFYLFILLSVFGLKAYCSRYEIHCPNAGELSSLLENISGDIDTLLIEGKIDQRDLYHIRDDRKEIALLDITKCSISFQGEDDFLPKSAFASSLLRTVYLPNTLKCIGDSAFWGCDSLYCLNYEPVYIDRKAKIPVTVTFIDKSAFGYTPIIRNWDLSGCTEMFTLNSCLHRCGAISLPPNLKVLEDSAFAYSSPFITELPSSIEKIGNAAFFYASYQGFDFSKLPNLTYIGDEAFKINISQGTLNCKFPASLEYIGREAFYLSSHLNEVDMSQCTKLKEIPDSCFSRSVLKSIVFPPNLERIGNYAFHFSTIEDGKVVFPASLKELGDNSFSYLYPQFPHLNFSNCQNLTHIGKWAFYTRFSHNESIDLSACSNMTVLGNSALYGSLATQILLPPNLKVIGNKALGISQIAEISIPSSLERLEERAFWYCTLTHIDLSHCWNLHYIGGGAFENCYRLTEVVFPDQINRIAPNLFKDASKLTCIDLSNYFSIQSIGHNAFDGCSSLERIEYPPNIETIGDSAFLNCSKLERVDLSPCSQLTAIGEGAYRNCNSLQSITLPESLQSLGDLAFCDCSSLSCVTALSQRPPQAGLSAFYRVADNALLFVPLNSRFFYSTADVWKTFLNLYIVDLESSELQASPFTLHGNNIVINEVCNADTASLFVYSLSGYMVYSKEVSPGEVLSLSLPKGVYIIQMGRFSEIVRFP